MWVSMVKKCGGPLAREVEGCVWVRELRGGVIDGKSDDGTPSRVKKGESQALSRQAAAPAASATP